MITKTKKCLAQIILFNKKGQILLQHRTDDAPTYPSEYCLFGGGIEHDESPEEAVRRECFEELEYVLENPTLLHHTVVQAKYGIRDKCVYTEEYNADKKLVLHEGQDMCWVTQDDIKTMPIIDHDRDVLDLFFLHNTTVYHRPGFHHI